MTAPNPQTDREVITKARRVIDRSYKNIEQQRRALKDAAERLNSERAKEIGDELARGYGQEIGGRATEALVKLLGSTPPKRES